MQGILFILPKISAMLGKLFSNFIKGRQSDARDGGLTELKISRISSYKDYESYINQSQQEINAKSLLERSLVPSDCTKFTLSGYCYVCRKHVDFYVDFNFAYKVGGILMPNWREHLLCPVCKLNNRTRAVVHMFDLECRPRQSSNSSIYITEQVTPLYARFKRLFANVYGSEYLGGSVACGGSNQEGIRNEDLTRLSFRSNEIDFVLSFDVLEHVPDYKKALEECFRCIKPGGSLLFTVPFDRASENNIVRAYLSQAGEIIHMLPPEYHGDPINSDGCLCFYHFGWEILEDLRAVGFNDVQALLYYSRHFGYLGGEQLILIARKR